MHRVKLSLASALALASGSVAQVVVPNSAALSEGDGTFNLTATAAAGRTYQMTIDSSQLTGLVGQNLAGLQWRLNGPGTAAWPTAATNYAAWDVYIGPGVDPSVMSSTFASNFTSAPTQVRSGPFSYAAGSHSFGSTPNAFGPTLDFTTPYLYTGGDLTIEMRFAAQTGSTTAPAFDALTASLGPGNGWGVNFSGRWTSSSTGLTGGNANFLVTQIIATPAGPTGACCLSSGASNCVVTTSAGCTGLGGNYQGDGSDCVTANCPPLPTGACCRNDGSCDVVTQNACTTTGGTYAGNNVTCAAANCPPGGACCFFSTCSTLTQSACVAANGTWQGAGSTCGSCPTVPPVIYSNCNISTGPLTLSGVAAAAGNLWSECAKDEVEPGLTNTTAGFGLTGALRLADDFVVPAGGMNIGYVKVYAYSTGATTVTATGATLRILDGSPTGTPNVVFGDQTTNRMANAAFTNIYRIFPTTVGLGSGTPCINGTPTAPGTTRRLQEIYITVNQFLPAGTYWLDYNTTGATFAPPATQSDAIGRACNPNNSNALQFNVSWVPLNDAGHGCLNGVVVNATNPANVQQDMYFEILGTLVGGGCYANCDGSTGTPLLTANDFQCFLNKYAANDTYANCDGSTGTPLLTANDFQCFLNKFAAGCT